MQRLVFCNRFFHPDASATSQILSDLALELDRTGSAVAVICSRLEYERHGVRLEARARLGGVDVYRVASSRFGRSRVIGRALDYLTFTLSAIVATFLLLRKGDVLVAKTDPPMLGVFLLLTAKLRRARLVQWCQDLFPEIAHVARFRGISGVPLRLLQALRNLSLRRSDAVIAISEAMRRLLIGAGVETGRVMVCHNWALGEVLPVSRGDNPLVQAWGLQDRFVIGYSGNMGRAHEFDTVTRAGEILRDESRILFLWIGGGAWRSNLEHIARVRGLDNWIFKPYQPREELHLSLSAPDMHLITLLPTMEGLVFPSKLYGILAAGRPTLFVGAENGEIARLLNEYECGVTVPVGRPDLFAKTVRELAEDRDKLAAMGLAARRAHETVFARELAIARWRAAVEPLLRSQT